MKDQSAICQSCGMPLESEENRGSESNGNSSLEYCKFCYQDGQFMDEGISLEDKIKKNIGMAMHMGMSAEEATSMANSILPGLKRWSAGG